MSETNAISGKYQYGKESQKPGASAPRDINQLDKDAFIKLLIAQFQYQDPLDPMDDKAFIAQMAQFSALEQMQNLNQAYEKSQGYNMIGREVYGMSYIQATNTYQEVSGVVTGVKTVNKETVLVVEYEKDGKLVTADLAMKDVEHVGENVVQLEMMKNMNVNIANQQYLGLVGQFVQAVTRDSKGKPTGYVEGEVTSVLFGPNGTRLVVGNEELDPGYIISTGKDSGIGLLGKEIKAWLRDSTDNVYGWQSYVIQNIKPNGDGFNLLFGGNSIYVDKIESLTKGYGLMGHSVTFMEEGALLGGVVTGIGVRSDKVQLILDNDPNKYIEVEKVTKVS